MPAVMLPYIVNPAGLPTATFSDLTQIREYELDATDHWIFNKAGSGNLTGLKAGIGLTQVGSTGPTHNAKSMTMPAAVGNQLSTGLADRLTYTWAAVVKVPAIGGGGVGFNLFDTFSNPPATGGNFSIQGSTSNDLYSRLQISGSPSLLGANVTDLTVGSWAFFAFAVDHSGSNRLRRLVTGVTATDITDSAAFTPSTTINLSLGAGAAGTGNGLEFACAMLWTDVAKTTAQLADIYARTKVTLARQSSITVV